MIINTILIIITIITSKKEVILFTKTHSIILGGGVNLAHNNLYALVLFFNVEEMHE